jgi:transcriptional regulator with XRE-family HTH domain
MISTLPDLIKAKLDSRGWTLRELGRRCEEIAEQLEAEGVKLSRSGVAIGALSNAMNGVTDPTLSTLRLIAMAFGDPMRPYLFALGYDPDHHPQFNRDDDTTGERRHSLAVAVEAAPDRLLGQIELLIAAEPAHREAIITFARWLEAEREKRPKR